MSDALNEQELCDGRDRVVEAYGNAIQAIALARRALSREQVGDFMFACSHKSALTGFKAAMSILRNDMTMWRRQ